MPHDSQFFKPLVKIVFHGTKSIFYLVSIIWDILPVTYKELPDSEVFKNRIKKWKPEDYPFRPCKTYVSIVVFVQNKMNYPN